MRRRGRRQYEREEGEEEEAKEVRIRREDRVGGEGGIRWGLR